MGVPSLCQACGKPNLEQARYCEDCGAALQADATVVTSEAKPAPSTSTYSYTSTYQTARATAYFISSVGWIIAVISGVVFLVSISEGGLAGLLFLPSLSGVIGGLLLIGVGQFSRAAVDTADFTGEMLAIMKATWPSERSH
jgi:hypothetical protein